MRNLTWATGAKMERENTKWS